MADLINLNAIREAQDRICGIAVRTPLVRLEHGKLRELGFSPHSGVEIYFKDESAQPIGSFKLRGAFNKVAQLSPAQLKRGVITYSSGNHAQGAAFAARALGSKAVIVMPEGAPKVKRDATAALGAEIVIVGNASTERKAKAEELAAKFGYAMVPPYDDEAIIAGQATCGIEILEQCPDADLVLSPVSGGGLLSGVATAIKLKCEADGCKAPHIWGCEPELAADAKESFDTRTLVEWPASKTVRTLADGLRTQSLGRRNFAHILHFVDGVVTVTEEEIRSALKVILAATDLVAEPSGAATLAAALFHGDQLPAAEKTVAIMSGGNLEPSLRAELEAEASLARV